IGDEPIRNGQRRMTASLFKKPRFGVPKILGIAQFSQFDEPAVVQRVVGLCRREVSLRLIDGTRGLSGICASVAQDRVDTFFPLGNRTLQGSKLSGDLFLLGNT